MLAATYAMVGRICPLGRDRVKVSENLGATAVAPVAPVVTSLPPKTNENKSHSSKIEFVHSFFGGNVGLKK